MFPAVTLIVTSALALWIPHATNAEKCIVYTPTECWFNLPPDLKAEPIAYPKCAFRECQFDQAKSMRCPFPSKGTFATVEKDVCPDFMKVEERKIPDCTSACCGGVMPGSFVNSTSDASVRDYVADASSKCSYFDYRRAEIVETLLGQSIDIVVAGDSMMRQTYLRLLQLMRGRRRNFDYRVHTHASYSYCEHMDTFKTASYQADMKQPEKQYLTDVIPEFFARHDDHPQFAKCTRGVGRFDFLHAPLFATHGISIEAYLKTASPKRRLVVMSYVGVWTKVPQIPSKYTQTLERVAAHKAGGVVLAVSIPTYRELRVTERAKKYRERNYRIREWVQLQEARAGLIDFETLSLVDNAPPTTVHDKHYMCYVTWPQIGRGGPDTATLRSKMLKLNSFREPLYDNPVGNVWMNQDGSCYDEMNRALWKVAFNTIMQSDTSEPGDYLLPRVFDDIVPPIYARGDLKGRTIGEAAIQDLNEEDIDTTGIEAAAPPLGVEEDGSDAAIAAANVKDSVKESGESSNTGDKKTSPGQHPIQQGNVGLDVEEWKKQELKKETLEEAKSRSHSVATPSSSSSSSSSVLQAALGSIGRVAETVSSKDSSGDLDAADEAMVISQADLGDAEDSDTKSKPSGSMGTTEDEVKAAAAASVPSPTQGAVDGGLTKHLDTDRESKPLIWRSRGT